MHSRHSLLLSVGLACVIVLLSAGPSAVAQGQGRFVPPHADAGVDTDGDSLYNVLRFDVNVEASVAGRFAVVADLYDATHTTRIDSQFDFPTIDRAAAITLEFSGALLTNLGIDGPYVADLFLYDDAFNLDDVGTHTTQMYLASQFDLAPARLEPPHADAGEDRDVPPDGLFNTLRVDVRVNVSETGNFGVFASLWDSAQTWPIDFQQVYAALPVGVQVLPVHFPGLTIQGSGVNGPYHVALALEEYAGGRAHAIDGGGHTTAPYAASDFQPANATLQGFVRDAPTGSGLPFAFVMAFHYRDDARLFGFTDAFGGYALDLYEGEWVVAFFEGMHDPAVLRVTVASPSTALNADLAPVTPAPAGSTLSFSTWDTADRVDASSLGSVSALIRQSVDWDYGNRDEFLDRSEWDILLPFSGFPPTAPPDTRDEFLVDATPFDLKPGTDAWTFLDVEGPIDSSVPIRMLHNASYMPQAPIPPGPRHVVDLYVPYDTPHTDATSTVDLSPGYVLWSYDAPSGATVSGRGTPSVTVDTGFDPDPLDTTYGVWVQLVAGVPDATPPTIAGAFVSPDPAEVGQPATISSTVTDDVFLESVTVDLRDPSGASLGNVTMTPAGADTFEHGLTSTSLGTYTFAVWATDGAGNVASHAGTFDVVDRTPPTIGSVSAVPDPQEYGMATRIAAQVTDNVAVTTVTVDVRDPSGGAAGNFSMAYNGSSGAYETVQTLLGLGTYAFTVWASDAAGHWASASGTLAIRDTTPPSVTGVSASPDPAELGDPVTISASASDPKGVASVTVEIRDPTGALVGIFPMTDVGGGVYGHTFLPAARGAYAYVVAATDDAGNARTASATSTVQDTTVPSVTASADDSVELGASATISVQASDLSGIASVTVEVRDPSGASLGSFPMTPAGGDAYEYAFTPSDVGTYAFEVGATDGAGNTAVTAGSFAVQDTTAPTADARPEQTVPAGTTVTFDGTASTDNDRVAEYAWTFTVDGLPVTLSGPGPTYRFDVPGTYVVTLTVTDPSGKQDTDTVTITVEPTTGSVAGKVVDAAGRPIPGATVRLLRDGSEVATKTTNAEGAFAFADLEPKTYTVSAEAAGFVTNSAAATVFAGYEASVTIELVHEAAPSGGDWLPYTVLAALLLAVAIALVLLRRRRGRPTGTRPEAKGPNL